MTTPHFAGCVLVLACLVATEVLPATVVWTGGGGNSLWQDPANWSDMTLPGADDDVVIDVGSELTVRSEANVTIRGLRCANHLALAGGTFRVTAGASVLEGRLTAHGNPTLSVTGRDTSFTCVGAIAADGASFEAVDGATVALPNLVSFAKGAGCAFVNWRATGEGSTLDLAGLATVTGGTCARLDIHAVAGGHIRLSSLTAIHEGTIVVLADGANSRVDLPVLQEALAASRKVAFDSRNGGTIAMPRFPGGPMVTVALRSGGNLATELFTRLAGFTVEGMTLDFPVLTHLHRADLTIRGGAVVTLPILENHDQGSGCATSFWEVTGAGSVLNLPSLRRLAGGDCGYLNVQALAGGTIVMDDLPVIAEGTVNFLADGPNSLVDLGALTESQATLRPVSFEARNTGAIHMPRFTGGATVTAAIGSGGTLPLEQFELLQGLSVRATTLELADITRIFHGNLEVSDGAVLRLPGLLHHEASEGCAVATWRVSGPGSVLDLTSLAHLIGGNCGWLDIQASAGGRVDLGNLTSIAGGTIRILAEGPDSRVDLTSLGQFLSPSGSSRLTSTNHGAVPLNPAGTIFSGVNIDLTTANQESPRTLLAPTNLSLYAIPWRSYRVERRDATAPSNGWTLFQRVPLTNDFQVVGPAAPAGAQFRALEFVAEPFALELTKVPGAGVLPVLYGPVDETFELRRSDHLDEPAAWQTIETVFMTNTFRILGLEPSTTSQRFFRARQP